MKKTIIILLTMLLSFSFVNICMAKEVEEETEKTKPLVFPKGDIEEHQSDIHLGSDPYYNEEKPEIKGSDTEGYEKDVDPDMQYFESKKKYKKVDKGKNKKD